LEKRAEQVLPGSQGCWGKREGPGTGRKNDPNNVCTCEKIKKKLFLTKKKKRKYLYWSLIKIL
jgi:hypothetical protein